MLMGLADQVREDSMSGATSYGMTSSVPGMYQGCIECYVNDRRSSPWSVLGAVTAEDGSSLASLSRR